MKGEKFPKREYYKRVFERSCITRIGRGHHIV
jgi:hypothetical protein